MCRHKCTCSGISGSFLKKRPSLKAGIYSSAELFRCAFVLNVLFNLLSLSVGVNLFLFIPAVSLGRLERPTVPVFFPKQDQSYHACREDCHSNLTFSSLMLWLFPTVRKFREGLVFNIARKKNATSASYFVS